MNYKLFFNLCLASARAFGILIAQWHGQKDFVQKSLSSNEFTILIGLTKILDTLKIEKNFMVSYSELKKLRKIGNSIAKKISKCPEVKAVAYVGSVATSFVDKYSKDIDLLCICDKLPSIEERRAYLGAQNYEEGLVTPSIESFKIGNIRVDIIFTSLNWFEWTLKLMDPYSAEAERLLYVIQTMKPIIDKKGVIEKLKRRGKYSKEYRKKKIKHQLSVLCNTGEIIKKLIKRGDIASINWRFAERIRVYINLIYALNYAYFDDVKWVEKRIKQFKIKPIKAIKYIRKMSEMGNSLEEIRQKMNLLKEMIINVSKIIQKEIAEINIESNLKKLEEWDRII